ncbi:MAG: enoyl-CoA hydratase-related protein [Alphaproteobacteria bacterium]|nr:enoyl-CoA hydratase-related protein [Alphaproteobacteria bacterium]
MAANEVLSERRGQSLIITFNRPDQANAMTLDMANQLFAILKNATTDRSVRAVMLCGAGRNFMNGLDMDPYCKDMNAALDNANQLILPFHSSIRELQTMDKPVLAVVDGYVSGAGFSMMLASDLVISSSTAQFNAAFGDHAITPIGGASFFLSRKVGMGRAMEIFMLCEDFDADRAKRLRLVNKIAEEGSLQEEALIWLDKLAQGPTKALGGIKKLACRAFEQDLNAQLGLEHTYFGQSSRGFDFREALRALNEKREANFTGS